MVEALALASHAVARGGPHIRGGARVDQVADGLEGAGHGVLEGLVPKVHGVGHGAKLAVALEGWVELDVVLVKGVLLELHEVRRRDLLPVLPPPRVDRPHRALVVCHGVAMATVRSVLPRHPVVVIAAGLAVRNGAVGPARVVDHGLGHDLLVPRRVTGEVSGVCLRVGVVGGAGAVPAPAVALPRVINSHPKGVGVGVKSDLHRVTGKKDVAVGRRGATAVPVARVVRVAVRKGLVVSPEEQALVVVIPRGRAD